MSSASNHPPPSVTTVVPYEQLMGLDLRLAMNESSLFFDGRGRIRESLRRVTSWLDNLTIPYAIAGGLCQFEHGYRRYTENINLLVTRDNLRTIHDLLDSAGYVRSFIGSRAIRDVMSGVKIDFLISGCYPGNGEPGAISFPDPQDVAIEIKGMSFLNLPTLINLKLASGLKSLDRERDLVDVAEMIRTLYLLDSLVHQLSPSVRQAFLTIWNRVEAARPRFVRYISVASTAERISGWNDLLTSSPNLAEEIAAMQAGGVAIDAAYGIRNGRIRIAVRDPSIAERFDMHPEDEFA